MFGVINQIARYALTIALMVPMLSVAILVSLVSVNLGWRILRCWNRLALKIFAIELQMEFETDDSDYRNGGVVVSLNQQSILDPTIAYAAWERRILSIWNIEYALIPFFGWSSISVGWIIVRQWPQQAKRQLNKAVQHVRSGGLVHLSAEGKRSLDGDLNPYKKGPVVLAIESRAPILPVYLVGTRNILPPGQWKINPGKVVIRFLSPIPTKGLSYDDRNALLDRLTEVGKDEHAKYKQLK